tara:strand:- start:101 stop:1285 length:1185 start_codon:yes stop_codon:yes gene_type:complete
MTESNSMNISRPRSAWIILIYTIGCLFIFSCTSSPEVFFLRTYLGIPGTENLIESSSGKQRPREISVPTKEIPRSIIFVIADGLGIGQFTLMYYDIPDFAPADFTHTGLMTVHPSGKRKVPDSANTASSMATGVKTHRGGIGVDENDNPVKTVLEWAEEIGMSTGLVATSSIAHATPASFVAHIDKRSKYEEIALQMAHSDVDVMLGGGKDHFSGEPLKIFSKKGGLVINEFDKSLDTEKPLLGLFADSHFRSAVEDREVKTLDMTRLAVKLLEKNSKGFFLMVEESQVDFAGHANNSEYMSAELASLNSVLRFCLDYQKEHPSTLVLFTADHETGGMSVEDTSEGALDIQFTTGHHTANMIPVFAIGPGAEAFSGVYDNTDIGKQLIYFVKNH